MTRALYAAVRWWLNLLPADDAGRRVFDETLADWRKEAALAAWPGARLWVAVRGTASALRGVVRVSCRELTLLSGSGVPRRFLLWLLLSQVATVLIFWGNAGGVSFTERLLWCVISTTFFLPAALFAACAVGGHGRRPPALGAGLGAVCLAVPLFVWAVPSANQTLNEANHARLILQMESTRIQREDIETPAGAGAAPLFYAAQAVVRRAWPQIPISFYFDWPALTQPGTRSGIFPSWWSAMQWSNFLGAYLTLCVLLPWLAVHLKRRSWALTTVASLAVLWLLLYQPVWAGALSHEWLFLWMFFGFGLPWVPVLFVLLAGLTLGRRDHWSAETLPLGVA